MLPDSSPSLAEPTPVPLSNTQKLNGFAQPQMQIKPEPTDPAAMSTKNVPNANGNGNANGKSMFGPSLQDYDKSFSLPTGETGVGVIGQSPAMQTIDYLDLLKNALSIPGMGLARPINPQM